MTIRIDNRQKIIKLNRSDIRRHVSILLKNIKMEDKEVSLVFMDNKGIQEINRDYLNRNCPTNVISFAFSEGDFSDVNPQLLGDIIISVERAMADSLEGDIPFEDELDFLLIHGLLHLVGYDHEGCRDEEATLMKQKEQELFLALKGYHIDQ